MFLGILDVFKQSFQFVFDSLNKIVVIGNSTMFDFIIVFFIAGSFIALFFNLFGASISTAGSSAVGYIHGQNERERRNSYETYKENRMRAIDYEKRFRKGD